jgi:hypothetical protein
MANNVTTAYEVKLEGPFFTGAIKGQMKNAIQAIEEDVADDLIETVQGIDDATFRHQTGYARSKVSKHRQGSIMTVDRSGLVYGPWLEDGGSRSDIFPGYHAFQRGTRDVDTRVPDHITSNLERYVIRPNT